jgi:thiol-disulfide isomerase/thioredoxin
MNRRQFLAGAVGLGLTGGAAYVATNGLSSDGLPVTVATIDAQGSSPGEQRIPAQGKPTLIDLFATWCGPCGPQMDVLNALHAEYGNEVRFVSVTNERLGGGLTLDDIRGWWTEHDGDWTVGHDPDSTLFNALGAGGLPYLALTDAEGELVWAHGGPAKESELREQLDTVLGN